ncbi:MAG: double-strand break repair helicase AddA, partial [Alphaproteobacteria bacterium]|nr:double-strand break repair helicase AddA [Alphaproteobacteria bacterium]
MQTIHGLCQSILRRFPLEAGVSPHFGVMEGRTEKALQFEARLRLLTNTSELSPQVQQALRELAQSQAESRLEKLLGEIFKSKRDLMVAFEQGADEAMRRIWQRVGLPADTTQESLVQSHFIYTDTQLSQLRAVCAALHHCPKPGDIDQKMGAALADWLVNPAQPEMAPRYCAAFLTAKREPLKKLYTNAALTDETLQEALKAEQQRVLRFTRACSALSLARSTGQLLTVAEALLSLYQQLKNSRAMLDFDDQIERAHHLLTQSDEMRQWVLYKLDGGIDHLLVDEAQDTSPTQWAIIAALTDEFFRGEGRARQERSIFIVGDEKQSIFSFQGAQPRELGRWQAEFTCRAHTAGKTALRLKRITSYRSTQQVLQAVDAVFAQPHVAQGLTFEDGPISHALHRAAEPGLVELWPLLVPPETQEKDDEGDDEDEAPARMLPQLARHIAATIRGWLDEGMMLQGKTPRAVEAGDIMILVRNRGAMVDALVRALKKQDVPVAGHDRMQLGDNLAVQDLVALGNVLLLPDDELTLAAVLKTPLFDIREEDLFTLAYGREGRSLWEQLNALRGVNPRFADAHALLTDLRARADFMPPYELYTYLLDACGGRARMLGRMGSEYQDPIDEFLGQLLQYEKSHTPSLQGFLHWLATSDSMIKRDMEQARGCVRILTVHASKGLQAPVVILPDTLL